MTPFSLSRFQLLLGKLAKLTVLGASVSLVVNTALAEQRSLPGLPTTPGFTVMGLTGNNTTGYGDMMLPLFGRSTSFFHINPQGLLNHGGEYTGSLGGGFRHLTESAGILGAYLFGDFNRAASGNHYWFVSPGVERLGEIVDISANLYIPTGQQRRDAGVASGEALGMFDHVSFERHSQFDSIFRTFESVGPGGDVEIGVRIPVINNPKLFVGGYYFNPKDNPDNNSRPQGLTARLEVPLTDQLMLIASEGYDNVERNTFKIGASYNFGGRKTSKDFKGDLTQRMVDPIRRNVIAVSGPSDTAQPVVQDNQLVEEKVLVRDHIAFFDENASSAGNGTFERPFNQFNQMNIDTANQGGNRNLYVNTGLYQTPTFLAPLVLTNNSLYGRQSVNGKSFIRSAVGNNRPLFTFSLANLADPAFELVGDNVFDSVRLQGNNNGIGIFMENLANENMLFSIHNSQVTNFDLGINALNSGNTLDVAVSHSSLSNNAFAGMFAHNVGTLFNLTTYHSNFNDNATTGLAVLVPDMSSEFNLITLHSNFNNNAFRGVDLDVSGVFNFVANYSTFNSNGVGVFLENIDTVSASFIANHSNFNHNEIAGVGVFSHDGIVTLVANHSSFNNNDIGLDISSLASIFNLTANDSTFNDNIDTHGLSAGNFGDGILNLVSNRSSFSGNTLNGMLLQNTGGGEFHVVANDSIFIGNGQYGVFGFNGSADPALMSITLNRPIFLGNGVRPTNKDEGSGAGIDWTITP